MYKGTRHREAYMRRGGLERGRGEGRRRGSVAPRSHAFRSVMAAAGRSDTLRPSSSCVHAHTAAWRRAPVGRPRCPRLKEEKKSDRGRRRGNDAHSLLLCARGVYWVFGDTSSLGIPGDHSRNAPRSLRVFSTRGCSSVLSDTEFV